MERYRFDDAKKNTLEKLRVPLAVFQFINNRVVTVLVSDGFCELFGFDDREKAVYDMDNKMYEAVHPDDKTRAADAAFRFSVEGGKYDVVYRTRTCLSDEYRIVHTVGEHIYTEDGVRLAYVWYTDEGAYHSEDDSGENSVSSGFRNALHEESIINTTNYDGLTGLPSMSYFFELADLWRRSRSDEDGDAVLLYFNLCGMKYFNRKYGFAQGDELLIRFSEILSKHFGSESCSRFGSDHFCVFTVAEDIEERLKSIFDEFSSDPVKPSLPVHAGICFEENGTLGISTECDRAKYACDSLHNSGTSEFMYFDDSMLAQSERHHYFIDNLDKAIRENWIQVYYQPIVRSANGMVCDEEALARWVDPNRGVISPAEFIPVLEEARLIYKLDLHVVDEVLKKIKIQERENLHIVPISINLSRSDFDSCDIVEEIRKRVEAAGISCSKINIEITESTLGKDFEYMKSQIERFRKLGFHIWMDDFGNGYSALDMLQSIHFDLIKFDMHFMRQFSVSDKSRIMLTELIRMAISLGMDTVCEGVETKEQADFLREVGCTMMQGYYYCRPITTEMILERYRMGRQIGFENPEESDYFAALGKVNLYDLAVLSNEDIESFEHYFNTVPMAILESTSDYFMMIRCNSTYRAFLMKMLGYLPFGKKVSYEKGDGITNMEFLNVIRECAEQGSKMLVEDKLPDGRIMHAYIKCIAVNPVNDKKALVIAILAITNIDKTTVNFTHIAKALFADYFSLYYVDINTDKYIEYSSNADLGELSVERYGDDFFTESRRNAQNVLWHEDLNKFLEAFKKENVLHYIDTKGSYLLTYRLMIDGVPTSVGLKAVRIKADDDHIVIGIAKRKEFSAANPGVRSVKPDGGDK